MNRDKVEHGRQTHQVLQVSPVVNFEPEFLKFTEMLNFHDLIFSRELKITFQGHSVETVIYASHILLSKTTLPYYLFLSFV